MQIKRKDLVRFFGSEANEEWIDAFVRLAPVLTEYYQFTPLRWQHFIGQVAHETRALGLKNMREDMYFTTTERIVEVYEYRLKRCIQLVNSGEVSEPKFAKGLTVWQLAEKCKRNPILLADIVYGDREGTPWMQGSRYLGRGGLQTTHLNGYALTYDEIRKQPGGSKCPNLVTNPEALEDPEWGVRAAFADWAIKGLNRWADADNCEMVSDALNTGNPYDKVKPLGLAERKRWVAKAKVVWPSSDVGSEAMIVLRRGDEGDEVRKLQERLKELGYNPGLIDGDFGLGTERALVNFQREHGLETDGIYGPKTKQALDASAPAQIGERGTLTAKDMKKRGSRIVAMTQRVKRFVAWVFGLGTAGTVDYATGLGLAETVLTHGEKVRSIAVRGMDLVSAGNGTLVLGILAGAALCGAAYWVADQIEKWRVEDANTGAHMGK